MAAALKFKETLVQRPIKMNRWLYKTGTEERSSVGNNNVVSKNTGAELTVLVVNASSAMAKEMSVLLTDAIPGCSITFAPSIELASWILSRKKIGLVISSPILPDGGISRLQFQLSKMAEPPDLVVVGDNRMSKHELTFGSRYRIAAKRTVPSSTASEIPKIIRRDAAQDASRIRDLGSDIRNDINNPLQEIVTMVFIAKASGALTESTASALSAIEGAAKSLSSVVQGIEDRITNVVG